VIGADSLETCMDLLTHGEFDLVVLDYNLKKNFSGYDILKEINIKYPYLPVIMVTAYGSEDLAVKVMKIGAKDYIRKTLDNNYIERIVTNVRTLVGKKNRENFARIKKDTIHYLRGKKKEFISQWHDRINVQEERFSIRTSEGLIAGDLLSGLFDAYIRDIEGNQVSDTTEMLRRLFHEKESENELFCMLELFNITFKEIAYVLLSDKYPDVFNVGSTIMDQINWIVDANDLVLSREYEKIIDESFHRTNEYEHTLAKTSLFTEIKSQLREALDDISTTANSLISSESRTEQEELESICNGIRRIENILDEQEKRLKKMREDESKRYVSRRNV
jgi:CheY-like chemotaxis protein